MRERELTGELLVMLGEAAFVALAQTFGGTRLYVPQTLDEDHEIARALGFEAAETLSRAFPRCELFVPLARPERARHYRSQGWSNSRIARALGMTENGVIKLLRRDTALIAGPSRSTNADQLRLF